MSWCEPRDLQDWFSRLFSLRSLTFILIVLLFAVFEFRFDWMERALGSYLSTTNRQRPETGIIWETDHHTQQAKDSRDEITVDREAVQNNARRAVDLSGIVKLLEDNQSVMISSDHFCSLYLKLPSSIKGRLISPMELLQLQAEGRWVRTYIRKFSNQLNIQMIDRNNYLLREIFVPDSTLVQIERGRVIHEFSLEDWGAAPDHIYPADRFLSALGSLPVDTQSEVLAQPEQILNAGGRLVRVGFREQLRTMWVDIGFELADGARKKVVVLPAREWTLGRLRSILENEATESTPIETETEVPIQP